MAGAPDAQRAHASVQRLTCDWLVHLLHRHFGGDLDFTGRGAAFVERVDTDSVSDSCCGTGVCSLGSFIGVYVMANAVCEEC